MLAAATHSVEVTGRSGAVGDLVEVGDTAVVSLGVVVLLLLVVFWGMLL